MEDRKIKDQKRSKDVNARQENAGKTAGLKNTGPENAERQGRT